MEVINMAIEAIVNQIMEKERGALKIESLDKEALFEFEGNLRRLSPEIEIDRDGIQKDVSGRELTARFAVVKDYEWVRERLISTLTQDAISVKLLDT